MYTLGINAAFHDSAATIVKDGEIIAAAEEERFTRIKHGKRPIPFSAYELPFHAIDYCLQEAGIDLKDVDHIAYSFNPDARLGRHSAETRLTLPMEPSAFPVAEEWENAWDPLFLASIKNAPRHLKDGVPHHLKKRFRDIGIKSPFKWHFIDHHTAHAASAYYPSPFDRAAIMTIDGRGEKTTTAYYAGRGRHMHLIGEVRMPHSLGMVYEALTSYLGFLHSSDEYKVMALASYGKPAYADDFRRMIRPDGKGGYAVDWFSFEERFGPAREKGAELEARHFDLAASLQHVLEETVIDLARWLKTRTGEENLCLAGGVALNCVMNGRLRKENIFRKIWVQPASGDSGTALGAALWVDSLESGRQKRITAMPHAYWGPSYPEEEIEEYLRWVKAPYRRAGNFAAEVAEILAAGKIVGWFQGRMEFGPRALGARSILGSPLEAGMQERMNDIKDREGFRPVAPVILEEESERWFAASALSPFMLFASDVKEDKKKLIPAVCHVDGTARVQTVGREHNAAYYDVIKSFYLLTGVPVLVNTSFNIRGEPIVCSPKDAVACFWTSPVDVLAIGPFLIEKEIRETKRHADIGRDPHIQATPAFKTLP